MAELRQISVKTSGLEVDMRSPFICSEVSLPRCASDGQHWFAVSTKPRHEKKVVQHLNQRGVQNYLPLYPALRKWQDRKVWVDLPLFSCYLFVRIATGERGKVAQVPGVVRMVSFSGKLVPITAQEMDRLRRVVEIWNAEPCPYVTKGKRVKVLSGPLEGVEGIVSHRKGKFRIVISVDSIMRSFTAEVDSTAVQLEPIRESQRNGVAHP